MTYKGIVKGKMIELETPLPYPEGQLVSVTVQPLAQQTRAGTPLAVREAMHEPPHLSSQDVDELERAIEHGRMPVKQNGVFDPPQ